MKERCSRKTCATINEPYDQTRYQVAFQLQLLAPTGAIVQHRHHITALSEELVACAANRPRRAQHEQLKNMAKDAQIMYFCLILSSPLKAEVDKPPFDHAPANGVQHRGSPGLGVVTDLACLVERGAC